MEDLDRRDVVNARRFVFSVLAAGAHYQQVSQVFLVAGVRLPGRSRVYEIQREMFRPILEQCLAECQYWKSQMTPDTVVAFDGGWSHRRSAMECVVVLIDCKQKKIVDFQIMTKSKCGLQGNYAGSSNGMEVAALRKLVRRWKHNRNVTGVVHDNDARASSVIRQEGWKVQEMFDPNHVVKQFERRWNAAVKTLPLISGLHGKLLAWFQLLIRSDYTLEQRKAFWLNAVNHFKGIHEGCPREHAPSTEPPLITTRDEEVQLKKFLDKTVELVGRTRNGFDTQLCESFNALKAHFASKDTSWKISWPMRVMLAILQMNSETNWRIPLAPKCGVELPPNVIAELQQNYEDERKWNEARGTPEAQLKECRRRWELRQKQKRLRAGATDYRFAQPDEQPRAPGADDSDDEMIPYALAIRRDRSIVVIDQERVPGQGIPSGTPAGGHDPEGAVDEGDMDAFQVVDDPELTQLSDDGDEGDMDAFSLAEERVSTLPPDDDDEGDMDEFPLVDNPESTQAREDGDEALDGEDQDPDITRALGEGFPIEDAYFEGWLEGKTYVLRRRDVPVPRFRLPNHGPRQLQPPVDWWKVQTPPPCPPPAQARRIRRPPDQRPPVQAAPDQRPPVQAAPAQRAPVQAAPVQRAPVQAAPARPPPVQAPLAQSHPTRMARPRESQADARFHRDMEQAIQASLADSYLPQVPSPDPDVERKRLENMRRYGGHTDPLDPWAGERALQAALRESARRGPVPAGPITVPEPRPLNFDTARFLAPGLRTTLAKAADVLPVKFEYSADIRDRQRPEPPEGTGITIAVYLADGRRGHRRFAREQMGAELYVWVASVTPEFPTASHRTQRFAMVIAPDQVVDTSRPLGDQIPGARILLNVMPLPRLPE